VSRTASAAIAEDGTEKEMIDARVNTFKKDVSFILFLIYSE